MKIMTDGTLVPGDLCVTGTNSRPLFRVIAVDDDRVWVRDVETGTDAIVNAGHCKRLARDPAEDADAPSAPPLEHELSSSGAPMPSGLVWPDGSPRF